MPKLISPSDAQFLLEEGEAILIDVRNPDEYEFCSIAGAILIPKDDLANADLSRYKDKVVIFHCQAGRRSGQACDMFNGSGLDVRALDGGLDAWMRQKLPVNSKV